MNILKIGIKNFLAISQVEFAPGKLNQIVGVNGQGKTSVLKALEVAFGGTTDGTVVRHGADQAEIIVELDDGMTINRRIKPNGKQEVSVKKGEMNASSPQSYLNSLIDHSSFNPLELLEPKRRAETLLKCIDIKVTEDDLKTAMPDCPVPMPPLDYAQHGLKVAEQAHKYFYQRRAEANKNAKLAIDKHLAMKSELPPVIDPPGFTEQEVKNKIDETNKLIAEDDMKLRMAKGNEQEFANATATLQRAKERRAALDAEAEALKKRMAEGDDFILHQIEMVKKAEAKAKECAVNQENNSTLRTQLTEMQGRMTTLAVYATAQEKQKRVDELKAQATDAEQFAAKLDECVDALGNKFKAALMAKAELPIPGLTYSDDQFFVDGIAIDNLATSKAMRLAVALARRQASKAKFITIDGCEALDEETFKAFEAETKDDGFLYFISKVGPAFPGESSVLTMQSGTVQAS